VHRRPEQTFCDASAVEHVCWDPICSTPQLPRASALSSPSEVPTTKLTMSHAMTTNESRVDDAWRDEREPSPTSVPPPYGCEELPPGWVKALDPESNQYFYVDALAEPPVSIWVHPFRHPQFLRSVGITPDEIPDDSDVTSTSQTAYERDENRPSPGGIMQKIKADKEARAAANTRIVRKRWRTKQLTYVEMRNVLIASRKSRGDWHDGEMELIPPDKFLYRGPAWKKDNAPKSFVRKVVTAFFKGGYPVTESRSL